MIKAWQSQKDKGRKSLVLVTFIIMLLFITISSKVVYALDTSNATFYIRINQEGGNGSYTITWYDSDDNEANMRSGTSAEKAWKSLEEHGRDTWGRLTEDFTFGAEGSNVSRTSVSGNFTSHTPYLYIQVTNPPEGKRIAGVRDDSGYMSTYQPDKYSILVDCGIYEGDWLADKNAGRTPKTREDESYYDITIIWEDDPDQQKVLNVNPLYWNGSSWQEFTDGSYGNFKISGSDAWQSDIYMNVTKGYTYSINATRSNRSNVYVDKITKVENGTETTIGTTSTGVQTLNADTTVNIYYKFTYDVIFNPNPTSVTSKNIYGDTITTNPTGSVTSIKNVKAGNSITMPSASSLTRTGYEFVGWSTNPSYSSLSFSSSLGGLNRVGTTVTPKSSGVNVSNGTTITFYAIWKPISYTVHYDMNLANEEQIPDKRVRFDETVAAPNSVTREDYEFRSWQVYDGSNYGGYTNNTNTDPSVGIGTKSYINANEKIKNLRSSDGTVTLVAIWKHFTDADGNDIEKPNANTSNSDSPFAPLWKNQAIDSPAGYFYYSDTPIVTNLGSVSASGTQIGYYLNTNQSTNWQYKRQALFANGDKATTSSWYYIDSFGYDYVSSTDTGNVQTVTSASFTSNKGKDGKSICGTGYNNVTLTDNNSMLIIPWVIMRDAWHDSHISYNETTTYHDTDGYTSLIGDNDIPTLEGIDKLENIVGLDKSNFTEYIVSLIGHDNISGLNLDKSSIVVTNYDNSQVVTIGKADNQELDEYNRYTHIDWSSFDVMTVNLENFADNLFNGDYGVTYHLEDNVGNVLDNTTNSSVFDLKVEAKTKQGIDTAEAELIKGEYFTLTVSTFGYANAVRIKFPENWYISERYPLYIYTGSLDGEYDAQLLVEITSDVLYVDKESNLGQLISNTDDGTWIQQFIIITPLYAAGGEDNIQVTAYKGDVHVKGFLNENQVYINNIIGNTVDKTKVKTLNRKQKITVASGANSSILDRLRYHIVEIN